MTAPLVRVVDAAEAAARDAAAIAAGTPSRALMQRAGAAAAGEIARRWGHRLARGVCVFAGPGNNGGDGWVVARALAAAGVPVRVHAVGDARTDDARFERALAEPFVRQGAWGGEPLVVDALLGTGARGEPRGELAEAVRAVAEARERGAVVVALDVPSGVDASTGAHGLAVRADCTLTFGTLKRGLLVARGLAGEIAVLDIGLGAAGDDDGAPALATDGWVRERLPRIAAEAHKGTRRKLAIVGGAEGMAGAALLAARAALRSGAGMVKLVVAPASVPVAQRALPAALADAWPDGDGALDPLTGWADAIVVSPGLGPSARALVERVMRAWRGPVLLDADALNAFAGDAASLGALVGDRAALLTPHPLEAARLAGAEPADVLARRFDVGAELARTTRAAVLLKGVPTVVSAPGGERVVSAAGSPALAAAGSGDLLAGIAGTLLAQMGDPLAAGACAAHVHGRAGERAAAGGVRGADLERVLDALPAAWWLDAPAPRYPVLAELPAVGERS